MDLKGFGLGFWVSLLYLSVLEVRSLSMNFGPKSKITNDPKTNSGPHAFPLPSTPHPFLKAPKCMNVAWVHVHGLMFA